MRPCKLLTALVLGAAVAFTGLPAQADGMGTAASAEAQQSSKGNVSWEKGAQAEVTALGIGLPPENAGRGGQALARRAAIVDAYRNLAEIIQGVNVDSETTMENLAVTSDVVRAKVSALVRGARIVGEGAEADGSYCVQIVVPLYGRNQSLAAVALPQLKQEKAAFASVEETELSSKEQDEIASASYTGVIIDASGMGLTPTFSPVIYDENGRAIYGIRNIDRDFAIEQGMTEYASDLQAAAGGASRAGANPLVLSAVAVQGGKNSANKVNVVVSVSDGDRILLANESSGVLERCAVVLVK